MIYSWGQLDIEAAFLLQDLWYEHVGTSFYDMLDQYQHTSSYNTRRCVSDSNTHRKFPFSQNK